MAALGIKPVSFGRLSGFSKSSASSFANGSLKPGATNLEQVDYWLNRLEEIQRVCKSIPINWDDTKGVQDLLTKVRTGVLEITIVDRSAGDYLKGGLDALSRPVETTEMQTEPTKSSYSLVAMVKSNVEEKPQTVSPERAKGTAETNSPARRPGGMVKNFG
jgi:hypothetical protein